MKTRNVLIVVFGIIIVSALFSPTPKTEVVSPLSSPTPVPVPTRTPGTRIEGKVLRDAFMGSCVTPTISEDYCDCAYRYLQDHSTLEEMMAVNELGEEAMVEFMIPAALDCLEYLGNDYEI